MACWYQRCHLPSPNLPRPSWGVVLLVMISSCLMYPVFKSLYFQIHSSLTGSYIPGAHSLAYVNCPNEQIAKDIGRGILEKRLAVSVNIMPKSSSLYIWKGEIEESTEILLVVRTKTDKISELCAYIGYVSLCETAVYHSHKRYTINALHKWFCHYTYNNDYDQVTTYGDHRLH
ncbi:homolog isoform X1 [Pelobates cultripes]|uniref:Homolog isoform X1 n=1 Tax=Pelobates cultripes TaxID=61616 RepID=A0AAD1WPD3_PELCU|nr:homolog isoform X1 [Pelobates cultripes]